MTKWPTPAAARYIIAAVPESKRWFCSGALGQAPQIFKFVFQALELGMKILIVGSVVIRNDGVQFNDKDLNLIDKFQHAFGDDDDAVIFSGGGSSDNAFTNYP